MLIALTICVDKAQNWHLALPWSVWGMCEKMEDLVTPISWKQSSTLNVGNEGKGVQVLYDIKSYYMYFSLYNLGINLYLIEKTELRLLKKFKMEMPKDPVIFLLGRYLCRYIIKTHTHIYTKNTWRDVIIVAFLQW